MGSAFAARSRSIRLIRWPWCFVWPSLSRGCGWPQNLSRGGTSGCPTRTQSLAVVPAREFARLVLPLRVDFYCLQCQSFHLARLLQPVRGRKSWVCLRLFLYVSPVRQYPSGQSFYGLLIGSVVSSVLDRPNPSHAHNHQLNNPRRVKSSLFLVCDL